MKKSLTLILLVISAFAIALPLHAQGGCVHSPENPTAVLALVGMAGACGGHLRNRFCLRRAAKKRNHQNGCTVTQHSPVGIAE